MIFGMNGRSRAVKDERLDWKSSDRGEHRARHSFFLDEVPAPGKSRA